MAKPKNKPNASIKNVNSNEPDVYIPDAKVQEAEPKSKNPFKIAKNVGKGANMTAKAGIGAKMLQMANAAMIFMGQMISTAGSLVGGFFSTIFGALKAVGNFVASVFTTTVSAISSLLNVGTTFATLVVTAISSLAVIGGVGSAVVIVNQQNIGIKDGQLEDCSTNVFEATSVLDTQIDANVTEQENAKKIYSILHVYGLSDSAIAGVLGNWSAESKIDPTLIEGIYNEPQNINGPRHQEAIKNHDSYTKNLIASYRSKGMKINEKQYIDTDGTYWPGVGLAQITNGNRLIGLSTSIGQNWWELEFQMALYLAKGTSLTTGAKGGTAFWETYKNEAGNLSPEEAALYFTRYYEGNTTYGMTTRLSMAKYWKEQMASFNVDENYARNVIDMAGQLGVQATDTKASEVISECQHVSQYDNSNLASAAVSFAYPNQGKMSFNNHGTDLFYRVHGAIFGGDELRFSCDRCVATAIRWSGSDDDYPVGDTAAQYTYLQTSDKWKKVGGLASTDIKDLQPGDILIIPRRSAGTPGHTFMYTGNEIIQKIHGGNSDLTPNSNSVSASYHERTPGVGVDATYFKKSPDFRGDYEIYRLVKPDNSPKYKGAGSGTVTK